MKTTASAAPREAALDLCEVKLLLLGVHKDRRVGRGRVVASDASSDSKFIPSPPRPAHTHDILNIHTSFSIGVEWTTHTCILYDENSI